MSIQKISSGFFDAKNIQNSEIIITENSEVFLFDELENIKKITLEKGAILHYFGYFYDQKHFDKFFDLVGENSKLFSKNLLFSKNSNISLKMHAKANNHHTTLENDIISFALENSDIFIDGILQIPAGLQKISGYLDEENIFLSSGGKIKGFPTLLVESNDISASHACKFHKISDENLFYLRSRGVPKNEAVNMMIETYIYKIFGDLENLDSQKFDNIKQNILSKI